MTIALPPTIRLENLPRSIEARVPQKVLRDWGNRLLHGRAAPLSDECFWTDPTAVAWHYVPDGTRRAPKFRRTHSGAIRGGDWDRAVIPYDPGTKERACIARWANGMRWEETGIFEHMLEKIARRGVADECRTLEDLRARYARLDRLFDETARTGRLRPRSELPERFRREHGGVFAHVARDGAVLRAGGGIHRFAIARILGLREMPVQIGVFHRDALHAGWPERMRRR